MNKQLMNYIEYRAENMKKYSEKMSNALEEIEKIIDSSVCELSFQYVDKELLYEENGNHETIKYKLFINSEGINVRIDNSNDYDYEYERIYEVSRLIQKKVIMRLPKFMTDYAKFIEEKTKEYNEVSMMAERMLSALNEKPTKYKYGSIYKPGE